MIDIEADGNWEGYVQQPRPTSGVAIPQTLEDEMPNVFGPIVFDGSHIATVSHSDTRNFIVEVLPTEGQFGELVVNEIGAYEGGTTF